MIIVKSKVKSHFCQIIFLKLIRKIVTVESKSSLIVSTSLKMSNCFSNKWITYRIILTKCYMFFSIWNQLISYLNLICSIFSQI